MAKIAIIGFGTVGSGVAEVLKMNQAHIDSLARESIEIKYILDIKDLSGSEYANRVIHDFSIIENDTEIDVVVETMGGEGLAYEYSKRSLNAGKSVVTSNKELVAKHGYELLQIAKANNVSYLFEASVGGGIPIIRPLTSCLVANQITKICGILNGTTNYIMTKMIREGVTFDFALKEAQKLGYAEQDPTADVEGIDACRKICILSTLAFGRHVYPDNIETEGITKVSVADAAYADSCGKTIKLLGRAELQSDGTVCIFVAPHLLDRSSPLGNVNDVFNAVLITGNAVGDVMFYGQGAGKLPTASAVTADIVDAVQHIGQRKYLTWEDSEPSQIRSPRTLKSRWYVRINISVEQARAIFGDIAMLARPGAPEGETAFLTNEMSCEELQTKLKGYQADSVFRVYE